MVNKVIYSNIPEELRSLPQWVGFMLTPGKNGKMNKLPVNPRTMYGASSTNPETWGTFREAVNSVGKVCSVGQNSGTVSGIGFVFAPPYCGIDLDHVIDENGAADILALDIVKKINSYTEISPSGTGLHIIYKGEIHPEWKKKQVDALGKGTDLEMYQTGRFFTVTGNLWENYGSVAQRDKEAQAVQNEYMDAGRKPSAKKPFPVRNNDLRDDDIIEAAMNSKSGMLFSDLFSGNWQNHYGSQSEADMAFCSMLAFWFGCDTQRMDAVFRRSGLMRDKWDRRQSGSTYGALTMQKAVEGCRETYAPGEPDSGFSITIKPGDKQDARVYTMDDTGNAQRLYDLYGERLRYIYTDKKWLIYDKNKWNYDMTGYIYKLIDKSVEKMKAERSYYEKYDAENDAKTLEAFDKHIRKSRSHNSKSALEKEAQHYNAVSPGELDNHRGLLNTPGGVIDLSDFTVSPCSPDYYFTKSTTVSLTEGAQCPLWHKFLNEIFGSDEEMIHYIQKAAGYSLSGYTDEQCAFFCYGTGRNGKTTFLDVIRSIAGDYASNIQPETLMLKGNNSGASGDIARLKGARFVTSVEPNEGMRLNEGLVKQLTGDDIVTARKLYCEEFEFRPEFKLWMATNHKPAIRSTDIGIWRRIHLVPFTALIPEDRVDRTLKDKLLKEAEGIFRWCLEGLRMYSEEGLEKPEAVKRATDAYKREMDIISRFLEECTVKSFAGFVKAKDLYNVYSAWCDQNGEYKLTNTKFGIEVVKRYEKKRLNGGIAYVGIEFSDEYKPYNISIKE